MTEHMTYIRVIDRLTHRTKTVLFTVGCAVAIPAIVLFVFAVCPNLLRGAL